MSSDLSVFAARLRDFIGISAGDSLYMEPSEDPALQAHLDAEFNGMAIVLFGRQFSHNAPYRKLCEARGIRPDAVTHWTQIPAVPTSAFKDLKLTCIPPEERSHVFHSSGTTAQAPSRHFHSAESLRVYEASLWPWFRKNVMEGFQAGEGRGAHLMVLSPTSADAPHSSLVHMFDFVRTQLELPGAVFFGSVSNGAWTLNHDRAVTRLETAVSEGEPLLLLGTAFSFVHLLDDLSQRCLRFRLPPGSRVMETGGYKGRSRVLPRLELHQLITDRLGIPGAQIVREYGMSELSSQAYDSGIRLAGQSETGSSTRLFRFPPWARAQVISPEHGREVAMDEIGLLRVFDLANAYSAMAIQTEDLAVRRTHGFELVGRAESSEPRGCSLMSDT